MQKVTKDLFLKAKGLHPILGAVSYYYGMDWKADRLMEVYYLEYPNHHVKFATEKELQTELRKIIDTAESDLGLAYPNTVKNIYKKE